MQESIRFVGLDVHAATIAMAVAEANGEVRSLGIIPNRPEAVRKLMRKLGPVQQLRVCYEAGPCGYALYWQMVELGVRCEVVAPTLIPVKPGERVKTDRRDARKLGAVHMLEGSSPRAHNRDGVVARLERFDPGGSMDEINVTDRVRIVRTETGAPVTARYFGQVIMIVDGTKCFVQLDNGGVAEVDVSQLTKVN